MNEAEAEQDWLTGNDPGQLFDMLRQPNYPRKREYTERKFRLWSCACSRRVRHQMTFATATCQKVVELAERYADGEIFYAPLKAIARRLEKALDAVPDEEVRKRADCCAAETALSAVWSDFDTALRSRRGPGFVYELVWDVEYYSANWEQLGGQDPVMELKERTERAMSDLLRDIFGNPFRHVAFDSACRTDTVLSLATQMYDSRDFGAMPILADALADAGCDDEDVLSHCRDTNQVHVRGCWVVDLVLGKEQRLTGSHS